MRLASRTEIWQKTAELASKHLNFYRVHLLFFCITPCIVAGIFYASNKDTYITYTDSLFMCVSAITVTGLNSTELTFLSGWQQVIIFLLMTVGSTSSVSIVTILIRRRFFRKRFEHLVKSSQEARLRCADVEAREASRHPFAPRRIYDKMLSRSASTKGSKKSKSNKKRKLDASMIRRTEDPGRPMHTRADEDPEKPTSETSEESTQKPAMEVGEGTVNKEASDEVAEKEATQTSPTVPTNTAPEPSAPPPDDLQPKHLTISDQEPAGLRHQRRTSEPGLLDDARHREVRKYQTLDHVGSRPLAVPRTRTIEFAERSPASDLRKRTLSKQHSRLDAGAAQMEGLSRVRSAGPGLPRTSTIDRRRQQRNYKTSGYGGFANPIEHGLHYLFKRAQPVFNRAATINRTPTMRANTNGSLGITRTGTIYSAHGGETEGRAVNYISFDAIVGRNSAFHSLTKAQEEELGGVEYRALGVLLYIVIAYYLGIQLISVLILAPYLSTSRFDHIFDDPSVTNVSPTWFTFFNVWSAFSNNGMCLIDASLTVFYNTYLLLFVTIFTIFAGNTGLPVFLRFFIWTLSKIVPSESRLHETLQFLLDHPRRCYIYLFPAYQTWFLLFVLIVLNCIDWISFLVLDIGNPVLDQIPLGTRIVDGLQQAAAVRSAGFAVVSLSSVAPALQVLYVIMMYIAVYPIALSIRSTNVYESKSLGLYEDEDDEDEMDAYFEKTAHAGSYIAYHARKQLAFDAWWLFGALFLIAIIQRDEISDPVTSTYMNEFTIIFELVSAYGTVGLSLGRPDSPTSLSGAFRNLAKLVVCAVMLRGRHRGLPNAIDRAVLLPSDLADIKSSTMDSYDAERMAMRARNRRASTRFDELGEGAEGGDSADDADGWVDESISPSDEPSTIPSSSRPMLPKRSSQPLTSEPEELDAEGIGSP